MSTFELLTEKKLRIDTSLSTGEEHLDEIIKSLGDSGNAEIEFLPLSDEHIKKAMELLEKEKDVAYDEYVIFIDGNVKVCYSSEISKIYALYEIKKHYDDGINCGVIYGGAIAPFRGYKTYLPPKEDIEKFKELIDLLLSLGYNNLTIELGGGAEYKSHPEINEGWVEICEFFSEYCGKTVDVQRMYRFPKNSIHIEIAGGKYLTEEELMDIADYCRTRHMEIIPEMPCLSHADYLLYKHPEFAEDKNDLYPDVACPSNDDYYKMLFDIFDDMIRVFKPSRINIGHDELYVLGICDKCKGKSAAELVGGDILKIHDYLKSKGVETLLWGDKIAKVWHGGNAAIHAKGEIYKTINIKGKDMPVGRFKCYSTNEYLEHLKTEPEMHAWYVQEAHQSADMLPHGLQVFNWSSYAGKYVEDEYSERGFISMYGNWAPSAFKGLKERCRKKNIIGASVSNWGHATNLQALQRSNSLYKIFYGAEVLWSGDYSDDKQQELMMPVGKKLFEYINRETLKGDHIEIHHTCDFNIEHESFDCGYWIEEEKFHIGDYKIELSDGSIIDYPVIWGKNIGQGSVRVGVKDESDSPALLNYLEACGISMPYKKENGEIYYKIVIPTDKKIKNITLTVTDKCDGKIKFEY